MTAAFYEPTARRRDLDAVTITDAPRALHSQSLVWR